MSSKFLKIFCKAANSEIFINKNEIVAIETLNEDNFSKFKVIIESEDEPEEKTIQDSFLVKMTSGDYYFISMAEMKNFLSLISN
jgi:hypothetical protein